MSEPVIGECIGCHLWPMKPIVLSCLHILCTRCVNNTEVCPQCREISTESVITVEKKVCVGCKKNREAVIKCRHCLCVECMTRPEVVIGCLACHWICSDCVTYHEELTLYDKHELERENSPQEITKVIIDCVKNKREELEREEREWKETIERDMKDVSGLQNLEKKMNKWIINIQMIIINKMKGIVSHKNINENVINCFNYIETFVNEIVPKMTADNELRQLMIKELIEFEIVNKDDDENNIKTVLEDIIIDISKFVDDLQDEPKECEINLREECETEVKRNEIVSVSDHVIEMALNGDIEAIQMSDIVREDNENNSDILDNSEEYIREISPMSSSQAQEEAQEIVVQEYNEENINDSQTSNSFHIDETDQKISEDNEEGIDNQDNSVLHFEENSEAKDNDKDWEYSSAEGDLKEDNECNQTSNTINDFNRHKLNVHSNERLFVCSVSDCRKRFKTISNLNRQKLIHSNEKSFKCNHNSCDYSSRQKSHLIKHKNRIHLRLKPHKCFHNNCNKTFVTSSHLKKHIRYKHSNERPFRCSVRDCEMAFKISNHRNKHLKSVHGLH